MATILQLLITDPQGNIPIFVNSLRAASAFERSMGLILVSDSVEMLIRGLQSLALRRPHV